MLARSVAGFMLVFFRLFGKGWVTYFLRLLYGYKYTGIWTETSSRYSAGRRNLGGGLPPEARKEASSQNNRARRSKGSNATIRYWNLASTELVRLLHSIVEARMPAERGSPSCIIITSSRFLELFRGTALHIKFCRGYLSASILASFLVLD